MLFLQKKEALKFFIITDIDWKKFYGTNNKNFKCRNEFN